MVQPKMSPSISFSVTYQKQFLRCRNRTNSCCRAHIYISTCFFPLYVVSKIYLSTIRWIYNTHLFSNFVIMTLNYVLYPILVQNLEKCSFWSFISISPASTHSDEQHHHLTTFPSYHPYRANIERQGFIMSIWFKTY